MICLSLINNVFLFLFSPEIVLTHLWLDLLDPYVKQIQINTLSSSPLSLPLCLALFTLLKNILSTKIQLYLLFTVLFCLFFCICVDISTSVWLDVLFGKSFLHLHGSHQKSLCFDIRRLKLLWLMERKFGRTSFFKTLK